MVTIDREGKHHGNKGRYSNKPGASANYSLDSSLVAEAYCIHCETEIYQGESPDEYEAKICFECDSDEFEFIDGANQLLILTSSVTNENSETSMTSDGVTNSIRRGRKDDIRKANRIAGGDIKVINTIVGKKDNLKCDCKNCDCPTCDCIKGYCKCKPGCGCSCECAKGHCNCSTYDSNHPACTGTCDKVRGYCDENCGCRALNSEGSPCNKCECFCWAPKEVKKLPEFQAVPNELAHPSKEFLEVAGPVRLANWRHILVNHSHEAKIPKKTKDKNTYFSKGFNIAKGIEQTVTRGRLPLSKKTGKPIEDTSNHKNRILEVDGELVEVGMFKANEDGEFLVITSYPTEEP